jgi:DTW domain-containing protein
MSQRRAGRSKRCLSCRINEQLCVCAKIQPLQISTNISVVVHVSELKLPSNTAYFIQKMLPENSLLSIRGKVNEVFNPAPLLERPGRALFLYPHEDAIELNQDFLSTHPGPYHLIVPDGNSHQARRVRRREEAFKQMMAVKLPPGIEAEYRLRRAPKPEWVSTYESVAHALGVLEGDGIRDHLMGFFRHWVNTTLFTRTQNSDFLIS